MLLAHGLNRHSFAYAQGGHARACFQLALAYECGRGVRAIDERRALRLYRQALRWGDERAQVRVWVWVWVWVWVCVVLVI